MVGDASICFSVRENNEFTINLSMITKLGCRNFKNDFLLSPDHARIRLRQERLMFEDEGDYSVFGWMVDGKGNVVSDVVEMTVGAERRGGEVCEGNDNDDDG